MRVEVKEAASSWADAAPLLNAVWPPEVVARLPWRDVTWARPDWRVLIFDAEGQIVGHAALVLREGTWKDERVKIAGVGGVATHEDQRRRGVARAAVSRAMKEARDVHRADFGMLFCEPRHAPVYENMAWHPFRGDVFAAQPVGRVRFSVTDPFVFDLKIGPRKGVIDLCGLPW